MTIGIYSAGVKYSKLSSNCLRTSSGIYLISSSVLRGLLGISSLNIKHTAGTSGASGT